MQAGDTCSGSKVETLVMLEREAAELEEKLKVVRASAVSLRAGILAEEIATDVEAIAPTPQSAIIPLSTFSIVQMAPEQEEQKSEKSPLPSVTLAELPLQHTLRRKWNLILDFPETKADVDAAYDVAVRGDFAQEGQLRLFGLLTNGEPWECSIVYSNLMNDGGITIGREANYADVVLADPSVSRCHTRLELTNRGLVVTDENSTNGTGINDVMLTNYDKQAMLNDGDMLNIAEINLFVELI